MHNFTPMASLVGGLLIGLSAAAMLLLNGRIAGVAGIAGGLLRPGPGETMWRLMFVAGLLVGGVALSAYAPELFTVDIHRPSIAVIAAGLLVGFGTRLGNGCTSGHGVCGVSRFSVRSLTATSAFIVTGAITVLLVRLLFGGAS